MNELLFILLLWPSLSRAICCRCSSRKRDHFPGCTEFEFACNDSRCIPVGWLCDGKQDCSDGKDEHHIHCHTHLHKNSSCMGNEVECQQQGIWRCIQHSWLCDGHQDCDDGSDEADCGSIHTSPQSTFCSIAEAPCLSGGCIPKNFLCDGVADCMDGSDEKCDLDVSNEPVSSPTTQIKTESIQPVQLTPDYVTFSPPVAGSIPLAEVEKPRGESDPLVLTTTDPPTLAPTSTTEKQTEPPTSVETIAPIESPSTPLSAETTAIPDLDLLKSSSPDFVTFYPDGTFSLAPIIEVIRAEVTSEVVESTTESSTSTTTSTTTTTESTTTTTTPTTTTTEEPTTTTTERSTIEPSTEEPPPSTIPPIVDPSPEPTKAISESIPLAPPENINIVHEVVASSSVPPWLRRQIQRPDIPPTIILPVPFTVVTISPGRVHRTEVVLPPTLPPDQRSEFTLAPINATVRNGIESFWDRLLHPAVRPTRRTDEVPVRILKSSPIVPVNSRENSTESSA